MSLTRERACLSLLFLALLASACSQPEPTPYSAAILDGNAVRGELARACTTARGNGHALLVEFSAAWCSDCQALHAMKQGSELSRELENWSVVVINVGQFDRHRDLLAHFGVERIAHWMILQPADCTRPVESWEPIAERSLELASGVDQGMPASQLVEWLRAYRPS